MTLGSVIIQMKSLSFLRLMVSSCIAELDLLRLTCIILMLPTSLDIDVLVRAAPTSAGSPV